MEKIYPVSSSETMKRCNIGLGEWRAATDAQREAWRTEARLAVKEENAAKNINIHESIISLTKRVTALENDRVLGRENNPPPNGGEGNTH